MKKLKIYYCLLFIISSCIAKKDVYGNYQYKGVSYGFSKEYNLLIKKDSFSMSYKSQDASPKCIGKWNIFQDTLYLRCNKEKLVTNMLSRGYMNQRDYKLKIIGSKRLKMLKENIILSKK
ncbi:hypothetical protein [Chryseobacterium sp. ISL-6]|uniref:hypothetical protein n=1 Tax=Chryseobacterium sp. ISL-6 TaxID=2819143 RepID=UPI001BED0E00|nr:hypothetical protein [Chryseobacterium sp. ISL-6]MBT2620305.1 hypothetical protein [Chryseobacterium sp. ISL-6]